MNILVIGDVHFKDGNSISTDKMQASLCEILEKNEFDFIVLTGDIYDQHSIMKIGVNKRVSDFINCLSSYSKLFIIVGNHDIRNNNCYLPEEHTLYQFKYNKNNLVVVDQPLIYEVKNYKFTFCPYVPEGRFHEALNIVEWSGSSIVFCHQEIKGVEVNGIKSNSRDVWKPEYPILVCGHIHKRQIIGNIHLPGTPYSQNFSEVGEKSISIYQIKSDEITFKYVDLNVPSHLKYECDAESFQDIISNIRQPENSSIRITVTDRQSKLNKIDDIKYIRQFKKKNIKLIIQKIPSKKQRQINQIDRNGTFIDYLYKYIKNSDDIDGSRDLIKALEKLQ